jgi:hypothetical protein
VALDGWARTTISSFYRTQSSWIYSKQYSEFTCASRSNLFQSDSGANTYPLKYHLPFDVGLFTLRFNRCSPFQYTGIHSLCIIASTFPMSVSQQTLQSPRRCRIPVFHLPFAAHRTSEPVAPRLPIATPITLRITKEHSRSFITSVWT